MNCVPTMPCHDRIVISPGLKHLPVKFDVGKMFLNIVLMHLGVTSPTVAVYENRGFLAPIHTSYDCSGQRKFPVSGISIT